MKLLPQTCTMAVVVVVASCRWHYACAFFTPARPPVLLATEKSVTPDRTTQLRHICGVRPRVVVGLAAGKGEKNISNGEAEQEPMDLDLSQMFEVFEAADREVADEEVGKTPTKEGTDENVPLSMIKDIFGADLPWAQSKDKKAP